MTPEQWQKIKEVLQTALELPPEARGDFLDSACAAQCSVRAEVESLLRSHDEDKAFLEHPAAIDPASLLDNTSPATWVGRRLGPYKVQEQIGEGGMGAVFRGVRADGLYDKQVAIKLIRSSLSTPFFASRFRNERQILAGLEHTNIARLIDGGITEQGAPYVVLEYVEGAPIDEYCLRHELPVSERLKLFRTVCSAVQYAHQNLVVHRDLKPGNILVTEDGIPKLLDFGIAKILDPQQEEVDRDRTLTVIRIMTPDFASPEQVRGDSITTATDIYSLGVILYVLLTGRRPYRVSSTAPHEIIKVICDTDPKKPSAAVTRFDKRENADQKQTLAGTGERTALDSKREKLGRALRGDLDNIVLKALRKEPDRRYATVEQFSEDVRRHLENLPVIARKDTPAYRASKFIQRHKAGVAAALAVMLTLVAALLITMREESIAQRRFNDVRSLANSLIFDVHDSIKDLPGSTPARKLIVDRALQYLNVLAQESGNDLALQRELATAYERVGLVQGHYLQNSLGDTQGSLTSYQRALAIRQRVDAKSSDWSDRLALAESHRLVANQQWALGENAAAVKNVAASAAISEALNAARPKNLRILKELRSDYQMAGTLQQNLYFGGGDPVKKEESIRRAVLTDEAMLALSPDDLDIKHGYATDLMELGTMLTYREKDLSGALACFKKELQIDQDLRRHSTDTRYARGVAVGYSHVGQAYDRLGDTEQSAENFSLGLEVSKELVLADPRNTHFQQGLAIAYANTANELSKMSRYPQSFDYLEKSDQIMRALVALAPENKQQRGLYAAMLVTNGITWGNLGKLDAALHDLGEAGASFELLEKTNSRSPEPSIRTLTCTEKMGEAALHSGDLKRAAAYFRSVLKEVEPELLKQNADPSVPYLAADSYSGLGDLELHTARQSGESSAKRRESFNQARAWYLKSLEAWHKIEHPIPVAPSGFEAGDPEKVAKNLRICDAALSSLH